MKKFVMIDGLDGSGKGTIISGISQWAERSNLKILNLKDYAIKNHRLPNETEINECEVIISSEPSFCYVGKAIREELVRASHTEYSAWTIAQAFAIDREILYKKVIIPALKADKMVFQERGIVSSLVYQPVQDRIQLSELMRLSGNKLAIMHAPNVLLISKVSPETVIKRLDIREKKDNSIFDNLVFQRKIAERYSSEWLKNLFEQHGSQVHYIDTNEPKTEKDTVDEALRILGL